MWIVKIYCSVLIGSAQPCDIYPGPATATLAELTTFESRMTFNDLAMCQKVGENVARQDELRTGNLYASECVRK